MDLKKYTEKHPVTKTVTIGLQPMYATGLNLQQQRPALRDIERSDMYPKAKEILDGIHCRFLTKAFDLCAKQFDFGAYVDTLESLSDKGDIIKLNRNFFGDVVKMITSLPAYEQLFSAKSFKKGTDESFEGLTAEEQDILFLYDGFHGFFAEYDTSKRAIYENVCLPGSATNRIYENADIFIKNRRLLSSLGPYQTAYDEVIQKDAIPSEYGELLTQAGIDRYNAVLGKLNQAFNEARAQMPKESKVRVIKLTPLRKQLLSKKEALFVQYTSDDMIVEALKAAPFEEYFASADALISYLETKRTHTFGDIFIRRGKLPEYSQLTGHRWNTVMEAVKSRMEETKSSLEQLLAGVSSTKKKAPDITLEQLEEKFKKVDVSIAFIDESLSRASLLPDADYETMVSFVIGSQNVIADAKASIAKMLQFLEAPRDKSLKENGVAEISNACKKLVSVNRLAKVFSGEASNDEFAGLLNEFLGYVGEIDRIYNKCRNYLTSKPFTIDKARLYFASPDLGSGWSDKGGVQNSMVMFRKDGRYYVGIKNPLMKKLGNWLPFSNAESGYEKMNYCFLKDFFKTMPKGTIRLKAAEAAFAAGESVYVADSDSFVYPFQITKEMHDISESEYDCPKYKIKYLLSGGDEAVYRDAVKKWIQFSYDFLKAYRSAQVFDIDSLLPLDQYKSVEDFNLAVDRITYSVSFDGGIISDADMERAVNQGLLFLFQIRNHDLDKLALYPDAKIGLFTHYFLDAVNAKPGVRLNGGVSIYYRPASLTDTFVHKKGSVMIAKFTKDGVRIPSNIYLPLFRYMNGSLSQLTEEQRAWLPRLKCKESHSDIVKDKRYTEDHYEIQLPITMNALIDEKSVTKQTRDDLVATKEHHVLALWRGKQNIFTYAVLNSSNKVVETGDFSTPSGMPYKKILFALEQEKINRIRDDWDASTKTKEVIDGYLSEIVGEVAKLILKYNAVLCVENPESNRRGVRIEKMAFNRLLVMLQNKLSFIYQSSGEGVQLVGEGAYFIQNGILFEVSSAGCESVDPTTGFISGFDFEKITRISQKKEFFDKFTSIVFDGKDFAFTFDYNNGFETYSVPDKSVWTVTSKGPRLEYNQKDKKNYPVDVSKELSAFLQNEGFTLKRGEDILPQLKDVSGELQNGAIWNNLFRLFRLAIRGSQIDFRTGKEDYISPVTGTLLPYAADAVGAINLARKGLCITDKVRKSDNPGKDELLVTPKEFLNLPAISSDSQKKRDLDSYEL